MSGRSDRSAAGDAASESALRIGPGSLPPRLLGTVSASLSRRRDDDDSPTDPKQPPPPPPPVSPPDLGIQLKDIRPDAPPCLSDDERANLIDAIRGAIASGYPEADVRARCLAASDPNDNTEAIGIWTRPPVNRIDSEARDRGLSRLDLLAGSESIGFFLNASFIRRIAQASWTDAPKRYTGDGVPDSSGPVHLTSFTVGFLAPNQVITTFEGYDERPWPDVDFTLKITDTLSASSLSLSCDSEQDLDADESWLSFLTFLSGIASVFSPIFLPAFGLFLYETIKVAGSDAPDEISGVGCDAVQVLPAELPIPGGQKLVFFYTRLDVTAGGIFTGGAYVGVPREPSVTIAGPSEIAVDYRQSRARGFFSVRTSDVRPDLDVAWSGDGVATSPGALATTVEFNTGGADVGAVLPRRVYARVTDADRLTASDEATVRLHVTDLVDETIPPVCRAKPWLPICEGVTERERPTEPRVRAGEAEAREEPVV